MEGKMNLRTAKALREVLNSRGEKKKPIIKLEVS